MESSKLHVAILSSPGMGHIIPVLVLGNRLATFHNLKITILVITTSTSSSDSQLLKITIPESALVGLSIIELPPVDISGQITPTTKPVTQLCMVVHEALPGIRSTIASMEHRPDALIVDLFCPSALPIADEFNMSKYLYVPTNALAASLFMYCHVLDKEIEGSYVDQKEPLKIPGCKPIQSQDVVDPMLDRNEQEYHEYMRLGIEFTRSDGILINTCEALEPVSLGALRENGILRSIVKVPIYPIGLLRRPADLACLNSEVLEWLDKQPAESVIYVSFGSGGILSAEQITELAWGLELSQQRFIWVVRPPYDVGASQGSNTNGTMDYLPEGFLERAQKLGFVIHLWAQQVEILGHPSVGGFLSHCGWNSTLESITSGVPMIAWPLYAEQRLNATIVTEELRLAVRPEVLPTKKVVGRKEIEKMIRTIMQYKEGHAMREKVKELKFSVDNALRNGGSSFNSMCEILEEMRLKSQNGNSGTILKGPDRHKQCDLGAANVII